MGKTIDIIKQKRKVSESVKQNIKDFNVMKKRILATMETEHKSVPQIAEELQLPLDVVTFHLMSLQKFGFVEVSELDDMDEYYFYKLKK
jgi:predicted ArsR family transcriptional regulator